MTGDSHPARLPAALVAELAPDDNEGFTMSLLSVRDDGWPHLALVSVGEVVPISEDRLRIALWPDSTPVRNLTARTRATLSAIAGGEAYALGLETRPLGRASLETGDLDVFECEVVECRTSVAPYADLTHGPRFRLHDRRAGLERWATTRRAMRSMPTETARP